jgi:parvulin-like peptidyl-prolyl isomerase
MKPRLSVPLVSLAVILARSSPGDVIERVIAKVGGDIITQTEFEARQIAAVQAARVSPDKIEAYLRENNARILQDAIDELLLLHRAHDMGMRMKPEYIKEVIENIKKENKIESDEALLEQLRREGMTLDELKRNIERSILVQQVRSRELQPKVTVTEADARAEYEAKKEEYTRPAVVHLQEIVLKGADAEARARDLLARARGGEDFGALARAHSSAPTAASGGDLGRLAHGEMTAELEKVAFRLEPGGVSEPIPMDGGFRIVRVMDKTPATVVPFEEAKTGILNRLAQTRFERVYEEYMDGLRKAESVDIRVREVPLQVDLPPSTPGLTVPEAKPPVEADEEFSTSPAAKPERVAPPPKPGETAPETKKPEERPTPRPPER